MASTGAASYVDAEGRTEVDKAVARISFRQLQKAFGLPVSVEIESVSVDVTLQQIALVLRLPSGVVPKPTDGSLWELQTEVNGNGIVLYGFRGPLPQS